MEKVDTREGFVSFTRDEWRWYVVSAHNVAYDALIDAGQEATREGIKECIVEVSRNMRDWQKFMHKAGVYRDQEIEKIKQGLVGQELSDKQRTNRARKIIIHKYLKIDDDPSSNCDFLDPVLNSNNMTIGPLYKPTE